MFRASAPPTAVAKDEPARVLPLRPPMVAQGTNACRQPPTAPRHLDHRLGDAIWGTNPMTDCQNALMGHREPVSRVLDVRTKGYSLWEQLI